MNKHKELLIGRQFTRNPVEELKIGDGKRIPCTWNHTANGGCPGTALVRSYVKRTGIQAFVLCRGGHLWVGRYG